MPLWERFMYPPAPPIPAGAYVRYFRDEPYIPTGFGMVVGQSPNIEHAYIVDIGDGRYWQAYRSEIEECSLLDVLTGDP